MPSFLSCKNLWARKGSYQAWPSASQSAAQHTSGGKSLSPVHNCLAATWHPILYWDAAQADSHWVQWTTLSRCHRCRWVAGSGSVAHSLPHTTTHVSAYTPHQTCLWVPSTEPPSCCHHHLGSWLVGVLVGWSGPLARWWMLMVRLQTHWDYWLASQHQEKCLMLAMVNYW